MVGQPLIDQASEIADLAPSGLFWQLRQVRFFSLIAFLARASLSLFESVRGECRGPSTNTKGIPAPRVTPCQVQVPPSRRISRRVVDGAPLATSSAYCLALPRIATITMTDCDSSSKRTSLIFEQGTGRSFRSR